MLKIESITFNPFSENTYLLHDDTKECMIVDPGCSNAAEEGLLVEKIASLGLKPVRLINTHCHIDHVLGNYFIHRKFGLELEIPIGEKENHRSVITYASAYGFPSYQHQEPHKLIPTEGEIVFGNSTLQVLNVPGHSPGHLAFYHAPSKACVNGDVLFNGSVGRTDLPGGNMERLLKSIREELFTLPDDTTVYCGHGPETTIGKEKRTNPFCKV